MGRPSIDPVVLFKMSLIQALYGIPSERGLAEEIHHNMAYRWFLGYGITDTIPDHTTISYNRTNVGADAGHFNLNVLEALAERNLTHVIGPRKYAGKKGKKSKCWLEYDPQQDEYTCFE